MLSASLLIVITFASQFARAEIVMTKPLVELGISGGGGYVPDYPAASEGKFRYLAFPVMNLRGKVLRSDDEDGSRARLFSSSVFAFELSAAGSFPASSDENDARAGMDDLEWLGELGPRVFATFFSDANTSARISFAVRGGFSTNLSSAHFRGVTFNPGLAVDRRNFFARYLTLTNRVSPQWTSWEMQDYFYGVPARDVLPDRDLYKARAGYIGTSYTTALWFEPGTYGIFAGINVNFHDGAANESSPLFRERVTFAGFAGFRWYFFKSNALGYL